MTYNQSVYEALRTLLQNQILGSPYPTPDHYIHACLRRSDIVTVSFGRFKANLVDVSIYEKMIRGHIDARDPNAFLPCPECEALDDE